MIVASTEGKISIEILAMYFSIPATPRDLMREL
jgi:hypothetical protein